MPSPTSQRIAQHRARGGAVKNEPEFYESVPSQPVPDEAGNPRSPQKLQLIALGGAVIAGLLGWLLLGGGAPEQVVAQPLPVQEEPIEPPENSLGIRFDEIRTLWNDLDHKPFIAEPLARVPETGQYDTFSYRFDASAVIAGAYDPDNDYVVALMVRGSIDHPAISNFYLHLCYMLHPFSAECIDNYHEIGLKGKSLKKLNKKGSDVKWEYEGNQWEVTVADNIETIRVIAPGAE